MASGGESKRTYHNGLFDKFMIDFKLYLNLELLGKFLIRKKLITEAQLAGVLREETQQLREKIERVVTIIRRKGPESFLEFAEALQECQKEAPDTGNDAILMILAEELTQELPDDRKFDQAIIDYTAMLAQVREQLKARNITIDQIKFCLQRITSMSAPTIDCITDYTTLMKVLERDRHLNQNDCEILIAIAATLRCHEIAHTVERYIRHCRMLPAPLTMEPPTGYTILSSEVSQQPVQEMSISRVREIKNTMRQSSQLLKHTDIIFQGCETDSRKLIWQTSNKNSAKLLEQFKATPKRFRVEGIVSLKEMTWVSQKQAPQHNDLPVEVCI